jgi:hypothetical protein
MIILKLIFPGDSSRNSGHPLSYLFLFPMTVGFWESVLLGSLSWAAFRTVVLISLHPSEVLSLVMFLPILSSYSWVFGSFWWHWGLNWGPHSCKAGALPLKPLCFILPSYRLKSLDIFLKGFCRKRAIGKGHLVFFGGGVFNLIQHMGSGVLCALLYVWGCWEKSKSQTLPC